MRMYNLLSCVMVVRYTVLYLCLPGREYRFVTRGVVQRLWRSLVCFSRCWKVAGLVDCHQDIRPLHG